MSKAKSDGFVDAMMWQLGLPVDEPPIVLTTYWTERLAERQRLVQEMIQGK